MVTKNLLSLKKLLWTLYIGIFTLFCLATAFDGIRNTVMANKNDLFSLMLLLIGIFFIVKYREVFKKVFDFAYALPIVIILGVLLRLLYFFVTDPAQVSDFSQADLFWHHLQETGGYDHYTVSVSELDNFQKYYSLYPAWGYYMLLMHGIYRLFGANPTSMVFLNIILDVITAMVIYRMIRRNASSCLAVASVFIFLLWPQYVIWASVTSPDHIVILFLSLSADIYFLYDNNRNNKKTALKYILLFAVCLNIASIFKPIYYYIIVAFICAEILISITGGKVGLKKSFLYCISSIAFILAFAFLFSSILKPILSSYIKTDVQQATPYYILWGYSVDNNGLYDPNYAAKYIEECESSETLAIGLEKIRGSVKDVIKNNFHLIPKIWHRKAYLLFYSDNWPAYWTSFNSDGLLNEEKYSMQAPWTGLWTILNSIMILIMPFSLKDKNPVVIFSSLSWMGYMLFLIVGAGIQPRYRVIVIVFQIILGVCGINNISKIKFIHVKSFHSEVKKR
jgi:4-amino-4-deoxy-L-arabinose transferase-like glycosyltransferase